jgi:hypothetical protein
MVFQFKKTTFSYKKDYNLIFHENDLEEEMDCYELLTNQKKYCFIGFPEKCSFNDDKVIAINMWNHIAFFSGFDGDLLYYTGLKETFVGLESLKNDYLIISDNSLFLINKEGFYPWGFKAIPDTIVGYNMTENDYEIRLKLDIDSELIEKLNYI